MNPDCNIAQTEVHALSGFDLVPSIRRNFLTKHFSLFIIPTKEFKSLFESATKVFILKIDVLHIKYGSITL